MEDENEIIDRKVTLQDNVNESDGSSEESMVSVEESVDDSS